MNCYIVFRDSAFQVITKKGYRLFSASSLSEAERYADGNGYKVESIFCELYTTPKTWYLLDSSTSRALVGKPTNIQRT